MKIFKKPVAIARVNDVDIVVIEPADKILEIKSVCDALGVPYREEIERIKYNFALKSKTKTEIVVSYGGLKIRTLGIPFSSSRDWMYDMASSGKYKINEGAYYEIIRLVEVFENELGV